MLVAEMQFVIDPVIDPILLNLTCFPNQRKTIACAVAAPLPGI